MPGTLYVVATPIGNLEDVTLRALRVLREVSLIAAEDTRRTGRLLQHYSISTPTTSLHEHNEGAKSPAIVERLVGGDSVAVVTDAGTPGVSDPGATLVSLARAAGIRVEPIPGPSAAMAALSASGFAVREFVFLGFPPFRSIARKRWLGRFQADERMLIFYEAPHRIRDTLQDMLDVLGDRVVFMARELTKAHEELVKQPISRLLAHVVEGRGEYTLVVSGAARANAPGLEVPADAQVAAEFGELTNIGGLSRREAIRRLAERYSLAARRVYRIVEDAKNSGE